MTLRGRNMTMLASLALSVAACSAPPDEGAASQPGASALEQDATTGSPEVLMPAPDLSDVTLLNQAAEEIDFEQLRGKPALVTFIYTRCPMPDMCPATTLRFQEVQNALSAAERQRVQLVSVSFDPFDTPDVLAGYADLWEVDGSFWEMLTGPEDVVRRVAAAYGVWYEKVEEMEAFNHPMYSMVLLPDGALHQVLLGSAWDSQAVAGTLVSLAEDPETSPR